MNHKLEKSLVYYKLLASNEYELASGVNPVNLSITRVDKCQDWFCILHFWSCFSVYSTFFFLNENLLGAKMFPLLDPEIQ